jgi:3-dehydroquinate synthase
MTMIKVQAERNYTVEIGISWREQLAATLASHNRTLVVVPEALSETLALESLGIDSNRIFLVPEGEAQKSVAIAEKLWQRCGDLNIQRSDAIVGIGGGATTDLAGFVAATWLRGISWYAFPTSLAGMVDASVGGKTGINTASGKNLVGAFHSPSLVAIDLGFLSSLSDRDFAAGLAEVIKCGFIADDSILHTVSLCQNIQQARTHASELVFKSVAVKAAVVGLDFKESKAREVLNYGHTVGHAIEKLSDYSMRHGEAVSIGLVFAAELSRLTHQLESDSVDRHIELLSRFGLPVRTEFDFESIMSLMAGDKKSRDGKLRFIGLSAIAAPVWIENPSSDNLRAAYERIGE